MNLSKIMGSMTLRERRMLNEAVKQRIVEGDPDAAPAAPAAPAPAIEPSADSPIGSSLSMGGKVVFELTDEGWKTTLRISEEQILALVIPAVQEELKKQMRAAKGQGDELHIVKSSLTDPGAANKSNELFLKRDGEEFADPVVIPGDKIKKMMDQYTLAYTAGTGAARVPPANPDDATAANDTYYVNAKFAIGAAKIGLENKQANMLVPLESLGGFDDLFGTTNDGKIRRAIQKAAGTKSLVSFKIPLSWAMDGSIMKYMSDSILRGVGIGKIEFKLTDGYYMASVNLNEKEIAALKAKLEARATANAAS